MIIETGKRDDIKAKTVIYRIFPRKWFFKLFLESANALVQPTKWEDPFENVILQSEVRTSCGKI